MKSDAKTLFVPILVIAIGAGWLLSVLNVVPEIDWIWTLSLAIAGVFTFVIGGFDKLTMVVGPFFIAASCLSVLRQTGRLSIDLEVPILVILIGVLLLIARFPWVPMPNWIVEDQKKP